MIVITVNTVTGTIVPSAAHTAKYVIPLSVLVVHTSAPHVMNRSVRVVQLNVKNVRKCFVKTA